MGLILFAAWCVPLRAAHAAEAPVASVRLRIEWGSSEPRLWQGGVEIAGGVVESCRPLGLESDEIGSMWIDGDALKIRAAGARTWDGVDVEVVAPLDAMLTVRLVSEKRVPKTFEFSLRSVLAEPAHTTLESEAARLIVRRAPGDALRVKLLHESAVYSLGETLDLELEPYLPGVEPGTRVELRAVLTPARGDREIWSDGTEREVVANEFSLGVIPFSAPAPAAEGVYDLSITATPQTLSSRFRWKRNIATRKVQVVVLDANAPARAGADEKSFTLLSEIDSANPKWWGQKPLAQAGGLMPGARRGAFGSGNSTPIQHASGMLMQLTAGASELQATWEAYPLAVQRPGQPHILEIEYPRDQAQLLGVSLVEPDASGAVKPIGLDSGVYLPISAADNTDSELARHRIVVWPRSKAPFVLLTNRQSTPAAYGKIRLLGPVANAAWQISKAADAHLSTAPHVSNSKGRLFAVGYDRPLFPQNFSATESLDGESKRPLSDWQTFYEGSTRLVEYLKHTGRNAAVVAALADGSAIYPSDLLDSTPRYDTGAFFGSAQDPTRKDVLELMYRLFDREGLKLIPSLQFSAPLPKLETLRRDPALCAAVQLSNPAGVPWISLHRARQGLGAYYNPLNAEVQTAVLEVVSELTTRYKGHASFGGIALQLSPDGYLQFPGEEWGASPEALARFSAERKIPASSAPGVLLEKHRAQWLDWRAAQLAAFHERIAAEVSAARPNARCFMLGAQMFNRPELEPAASPRGDINLAVSLKATGLNASMESKSKSLVWLRPERIAAPVDLASESKNIRFNSDPAIDAALAPAAVPGALFFHEPQELRLRSFDSVSPFQPCQMWIMAQHSPSEAQNRRRFIEALARFDARAIVDSGWLLPMGQEQTLADFACIYNQLPDAPFETFPQETQPVVIRTHRDSTGAYAYLVNDSPWAARVTLSMSIDAARSILSLKTDAARLSPRPGQGVSTLDIILEPYGIAGFRADDTKMRLVDATVAIGPEAAIALDQRIRELSARVASLQQTRTVTTIKNSGFDDATEGAAIPGWSVRSGAAETTATEPQEGARRLRLAGGRGVASVESDSFEPPHLDRLTLYAWARLTGDPARSRLRMTLEGTTSQGKLAWHAPLCAPDGAPARAAAWNRYELTVDRAPPGLRDLCVIFEFEGAGEAAIDSVQIVEPALDRDELNELRKLLTVANFKLQEGKLAECLRLLDGYWPRYLESRVPLPPINVASTRPLSPPPSKPTLRDKWKNYLPGMLR